MNSVRPSRPPNVQLEIAAPGMKKEDFNVVIEQDLITISAQKHTEESQDGKYTKREFSFKSFKRSFALPDYVRRDGIEATYIDGVLYLTIPKVEEAKVKAPIQINIK